MQWGRNKGLTLIEMVMVVAIMLITGFIVGPNIAKNYHGLDARLDAQKLASKLRWAQQSAIMEQTPYRVILNIPGKSYTISQWNGSGYTDIETISLSNDVFYHSNSLASNTVEFDIFGGPVPQGGSIMFRNVYWWVTGVAIADVTGRISHQ